MRHDPDSRKSAAICEGGKGKFSTPPLQARYPRISTGVRGVGLVGARQQKEASSPGASAMSHCGCAPVAENGRGAFSANGRSGPKADQSSAQDWKNIYVLEQYRR